MNFFKSAIESVKSIFITSDSINKEDIDESIEYEEDHAELNTSANGQKTDLQSIDYTNQKINIKISNVESCLNQENHETLSQIKQIQENKIIIVNNIELFNDFKLIDDSKSESEFEFSIGSSNKEIDQLDDSLWKPDVDPEKFDSSCEVNNTENIFKESKNVLNSISVNLVEEKKNNLKISCYFCGSCFESGKNYEMHLISKHIKTVEIRVQKLTGSQIGTKNKIDENCKKILKQKRQYIKKVNKKDLSLATVDQEEQGNSKKKYKMRKNIGKKFIL